MSAAEDDGTWECAAAEARATFGEWRAAHPRATLRQVEAGLDRHPAGGRARLLGAAALAGPDAANPPACPACGAPMIWDGEHSRRLTTAHQATLTLTWRYARCPARGAGLFPPR